jgi:hypothetical protein
MDEQNASRPYFFKQFPGKSSYPAIAAIKGPTVKIHADHFPLMQNRTETRVGNPPPAAGISKGGSRKKTGHPAIGLFPRQTPGCTKHQQHIMTIGMITHRVTISENSSDQVRIFYGLSAGHKKGGFYSSLPQQRQHNGRHYSVRTVVESQSHNSLCRISPADQRQEIAPSWEKRRNDTGTDINN